MPLPLSMTYMTGGRLIYCEAFEKIDAFQEERYGSFLIKLGSTCHL